jgi:glutaminyl-peptide cyclotransferase
MSKKKSAPAPAPVPAARDGGSLFHYDPNRKFLIFLFFLIAIGGGILAMVLRDNSEVPVYGWELVNKHPHDPQAFTQGLLVDPSDGTLLESTGQRGQSSIRRIELGTAAPIKQVPLDAALFGEGIAIHGTQIIQLTWQEGRALRWTMALEPDGESAYDGEGWGLTSDGTHLIMSDGTRQIDFRNPQDFSVVRSILVTRGGRPVDKLNELEYFAGKIYANRLYSDLIYEIDPASGDVTAVIDLAGLWPLSERPRDGLMNGIAIPQSSEDRPVFYVTGKYCPFIYEIRTKPPGTP